MMQDPITYFLSAEVTLSDKLLEVLYFVIGLICIYTAAANLRDKGNQKRYGTFVFWLTLGLMFVLGPWIPSLYTGILMCVMVAVPILLRCLCAGRRVVHFVLSAGRHGRGRVRGSDHPDDLFA